MIPGIRPAILLSLVSVSACQADITFNRDIRPILSENCFYCHGQDPKHREADLRLDERDGALRDLGGYAAVVPGNPEKSELIKRLLTHEKDDLMPPEKANRHVSPQQVALLKRWISEGAVYEKHWAYLPPKQSALPETKNGNWARHPLDRYILARLEQEGLQPAPEANPETWFRRVSLDLTGLPPSPHDIDTFLASVATRGESAYGAATDTLLASKHFGERLALDWLDAARYADTHGFNNDTSRTMWRWRDWVINAFNTNLPYDRFLTEQLAGDQLPNPTLEQRIATGFSRNHVINSEGGIIDEEYRVEYVADRVRTMSTAWLGLTTECARCHDHKYDPITQKDYYRFFAFFNNVPEHGEDGRIANAVPMIVAPTEQQQRLLAIQERTLRDLDTQLAEISTDRVLSEQEQRRALASAKQTIEPLKASELLEVKEGKRMVKKLSFEAKEGITLTFMLRVDKENPEDVPLLSALNYKGSPADAQYGKGRELRLIHGELEWRDSNRFPVYAQVIRTEGATLSPNQWHHVTLAFGPKKTPQQTRVFIDGEEIATRTRYNGGAAPDASTFKIGTDNQESGVALKGEIKELSSFQADLSSKEIRALALVTASRESATALQARLASLMEVGPDSRLLLETRTDLWEKHLALKRSFPTAMVMQDLPEPRQAFVLTRGNYDAHGEPVSPGVPEKFIAPWPEDAPRNRLGLAKWFTQPQHPLTSRVVVNRFWAQLFGTGLVKTLEDFGSQGEWPSHPELLDWLAREFIDGGWNVKSLFKQIVLSAAYRQNSAASAELVARDPENRLLAHGPRVRLPAEVIRDQALTVSGLLTTPIGGPSVFPYQPQKLYEGIVVGTDYPGTKWVQSHGDSLYRRSLYTFWKRTVPHPAMLTFDTPDREVCTVRRSRTNTPMQALLLWNEPGYLEAARVLGTRILKEGGDSDTAKMAFGFRLTTGRHASESETNTLLKTLRKLRDDFAAHPEEAEAFIKIGEAPSDPSLPATEIAAAMGVANLLLNLDETITKN